ncbi:MAG TPA: hypothetical protein VMT53_24325 [Terriglobales bacterium]|nr:hypothetical protein [Terriglobales bacterium]
MTARKGATHSQSEDRGIYPAHSDPIRIVPLNVPEELVSEKAVAAAAPQFTYRNGPLISAVEVFTIFWGPGWAKAPTSDLVAQTDDFFRHIERGPYAPDVEYQSRRAYIFARKVLWLQTEKPHVK